MDRDVPFSSAARAVDAWLRWEPGLVLRAARELDWWQLRAVHELLPAGHAKLVLPTGFPGEPPEVYVSEDRCLVVPHVESNGRVCTGVASQPDDYADPIGAVRRALQALAELLDKSLDPAWREQEFAREARSYWDAHCLQRRRAADARPVPVLMDADLSGLAEVADGTLGVFTLGKEGARNAATLVATAGTQDPRSLAARHGRAAGTHVAGHALFVRLPNTFAWTPQAWPKSLLQLGQLVSQVTAGEVQLPAWLAKRKDRKPRPYSVIFVHGEIAYGYLLTPAVVPWLAPAGIFPIGVRRLDADWALVRGQGLIILHRRRKARVLLLGAGSLGGPVAEHLVRSGVGDLTAVDHETMESENTGRHTLGHTSVGRYKVQELRTRLRQEVPGVSVKAEPMRAARYVQANVQPGVFDLVVDCTAESAVRTLLSVHRYGRLAGTSVVMAWVEPFCAAAHVVALGAADEWPMSDPADQAINVAEWPDDPRVKLPMCGAGFHQYGSADIGQAAGFVAQRILDIIDGAAALPKVWSRIRSREFFDSLPVRSEPRTVVAALGSASGAMEIERNFRDVIEPDGD
jgi:hypothetical protein